MSSRRLGRPRIGSRPLPRRRCRRRSRRPRRTPSPALGLSGEAEIKRVRDWLLLLRECRAHQADPEGSAPPAGVIAFDPAMTEGSTPQPRPVIRAMSGGALEVREAAHRLGLRVDDDRRRFAPGREVFPRYVDRIHLGAVLAHCGRGCAHAEALRKTAALRQTDGRSTPHDPAPPS